MEMRRAEAQLGHLTCGTRVRALQGGPTCQTGSVFCALEDVAVDVKVKRQPARTAMLCRS